MSTELNGFSLAILAFPPPDNNIASGDVDPWPWYHDLMIPIIKYVPVSLYMIWIQEIHVFG